jgi:uncharacterized metal-binding protein
MYQWSGIEWVLHPLPNLLLIITACVWGLTFGLLGMDSTPRFGPIAELFKPYAKFFKERSFIVALFASPVINIFVTQIILTAVDYLLGHYMAWHSNATSIILFITINVAAFIFYADD